MSTRCKPGDLVLVIKGVDTGKTATILREATLEERKRAVESLMNETCVELSRNLVWLLDRDMTCRVKGRQTGKIYAEGQFPFKADSNLLPITPPASMHTKEQSKELSHG